MKVICRTLPKPEGWLFSGGPFDISPANSEVHSKQVSRRDLYPVSVSDQYDVHGILVDKVGHAHFLVLNDLRVADIASTWTAVLPASIFEFIDSQLNADWHLIESGPTMDDWTSFSLGPREWGSLWKFCIDLNEGTAHAAQLAQPLVSEATK